MHLEAAALGRRGAQVKRDVDAADREVLLDRQLLVRPELDRPELARAVPERVQLARRGAAQRAVRAQGELARHGELAAPAVGLRGQRAPVGAHPPHEDAATIRRLERLRRVEVLAPVERAEVPLGGEGLSGPPRAHEIAGVVEVAEAVAVRPRSHGGEAEHPAAGSARRLELKEVGALEHVDAWVGVAVEHALGAPGEQVLRAIEHHLPAAVQRATAHDHEPRVALAPDLGVAEVPQVLGVSHHDAALLEADPVRGGGQALDLEVALVLVGAVAPAVRRVERVEEPVRPGHGRARVDAGALGLEARRQGDGLRAPVREVGARGMAPVHGAPLRAEGMELVEGVPAPAEEAQPVGVVDPAAGGGHVEGGVPAVAPRGGELGHGPVCARELPLVRREGCVGTVLGHGASLACAVPAPPVREIDSTPV